MDSGVVEVTQEDLKMFQTLRDTVGVLRTVAEDELMACGHTYAGGATLTAVIHAAIEIAEVIDQNEQALVDAVGDEFEELLDFGGD